MNIRDFAYLEAHWIRAKFTTYIHATDFPAVTLTVVSVLSKDVMDKYKMVVYLSY